MNFLGFALPVARPVAPRAGMEKTAALAVTQGKSRRLLPTRLAVGALLAASLASGTSAQAAIRSFPATNVGTTSAPQNVFVTLVTGGRIASVQAMTGGAANLDYSISGAGSCAVGSSYLAGQVCTFPVTFTPAYPGQRSGALLISDGAQALGMTPTVGTGNGPLALFVPGVIHTVAGDQAWIYRGDGGAATASPIFLPFGLAVDAAGNLFIADSSNNRIRRVDAATQTISTLAGNGSAGASGDNGPALSASLSIPTSVAVDGAGNVYFADSNNHAVRRIDAVSAIVTTVAGTLGVAGYNGDGGSATAAHLNTPDAIALDLVNGFLYIADTGNNVVRKLNLSTGNLSAFAGNHVAAFSGDGASALSSSMDGPWGIAVGADGQVYIADQNNHRIRKVALDGTISTVAGTGTSGFSGDGGLPGAAQLDSPAAIALDPAGNLYIADSGNNRVRKVNAHTGLIQTVAGSTTEAFSGDGGPADQAGLYGPYAMVLDGKGDLFLTDVFHNRIREISSTVVTLDFPTIRINRVSSTRDETLENDGNAAWQISALTPGSNTQIDPIATTCSRTATVATADICILGAQFAPTVLGNLATGTIRIASDSPNTPQIITLEGQVISLDPSTVTLLTSGSSSITGSSVTFSSTVSSAGITPTGSVTFYDGTASLGSGTLNGSGVAQFSTAALTHGSHAITASYAGDTNTAPGTSSAVTQVVKDATSTVLTSNLSPSSSQQPVTLRAVVTSAGGIPTGSVTFVDGVGTRVGTGTLDSSGAATLTLSTLSVGSHSIVATYSGDTLSNASVSSALNQQVAALSTTTTISTSNADATFGTTIVFSTSVLSSSGTPTGTVTFFDGSTTIGLSTLDLHGSASLSLSTLAVGSHSLHVVYAGDTNYATSTSTALQQTTEQMTTATTLTSNGTPSAAGAASTLTATIKPSTPVPSVPITGSVTFMDGTTSLGSASVSGGSATLNVSTLAIGTHTLTAIYGGATDYSGSTSSALTQTVQKAVSTASLAASINPSTAGRSVIFAITMTSTGSIPTGSVILMDGSTPLSSVALNSGVGSYSTSTLSAGNHNLSAVYAGDTNNLGSSATLLFTVNQASTSVALRTSGSPSAASLSVTFSATVTGSGGTPTGLVNFLDGSTNLGSSSLNNAGQTTFSLSSLTVGSHTITAAYVGDTNDLASTSPSLVQTVVKSTTTISLTASASSTPVGSPVTLTASINSTTGTPTGNVQFLDGSTVLGTIALTPANTAVFMTSSLIVGQHLLSAVYVGDSNNSTSTSASLTEVIQSVTSVALATSANPAIAGANVTFTAAVSGSTPVPTGLVTLHDGTTILGSVPLNAAGVASFTTPALALGSHTLTASYAGDTNNPSATSTPLTEIIQRATSQTALTVSSLSAVVGAPVVLNVSVTSNGGTPAGVVTFYDGTTIIGTANLASGSASFSIGNLPLGLHTLTASYSGDANDSSSTSSVQTVTVQKASPLMTLISSNNPAITGSAVTFTTTLSGGAASPSGSVIWSDGSTVLGTTSLSANGTNNGTASFTTSALNVGTHSINAAYSGDPNNLTAQSTPLSQTVQRASSQTSLAASTTTAIVGNSINFSVSVTGVSGTPTGQIALLDGPTVLATANLIAGVVVVPVSNLTLGQHSITASYGGDTVNSPSTSAGQTVAIQKASPSLTILSTNNPANIGAPVTFTATIGGAAGTVSGSVTWSDGASVLGTSVFAPNATTSFTTSILSGGAHAIVASFAGDTQNLAAASPALNEVVQRATTQVTLAASVATALIASPITFNVNVTGPSGTPTGQVTLLDGATALGIANLSAGSASFTLGTLALGSHFIVASYGGDTNNNASTSSPQTVLIQKASPTVTLSSVNNPAITGASIIFTATLASAAASPGGLVTWSDGGSTIGTTAMGANGVANFSTSSLATGVHLITVTYAGDTNDNATTSAPLSETVQKATSQTSLSVSSVSAVIGTPVLFSVTVTSAAGTLSGQVTLLDGNTVLATAPLTSGSASFTISTLALGPHTLTASYAGDANDSASASAQQTVTVQKGSPSIVLAANNNPAITGTPVTFTATLSGGVTPGGSMSWSDGGTVLASAPLANGSASFTTSSLTGGAHSLTANYAGDGQNNSATSAPLAETVQQATSSVTLTSNKNPAPIGDVVTFTIAVSGTGVAPTGLISLHDGTVNLGSASVDTNGIATLTSSSLALGVHPLTAMYAGDAMHSGSQSAPYLETIQQTTQTTLTSNSNPSYLGGSVIFTATVSGSGGNATTGSVIFRDGGAILGSVAVGANGGASFSTSSLVVGQHSVTATYGGDTLSQASTSSVLVETVRTSDTMTVLSGSGTPSLLGSTVTLTAIVIGKSIPPTGTVDFQDGTTLLGSAQINAAGQTALAVSNLTVGQHILLAIYRGDQDNLASTSNPLLESVQQASSVSLNANANPAPVTSIVVFTAKAYGGPSTPIPTGLMSLLDGSNVVATAPLNTTGTATFSVSTLRAGAHSLTANYAGDSLNLPASSSTLSETIQPMPSTNVLTVSPASAPQGQPITLTATLSGNGPAPPTGSVVFSFGSTTLGSSPLNAAGVASFTTTFTLGTYTVLSTYQGDALYSGSTSVPVTVNVTEPTHFTLTLDPPTMKLQSSQHSTAHLTITSIQGFTDLLSLGCVGLPHAATCTFTSDQVSLAANGAQKIDLVIDTGSPLTAGSVARNEAARSMNITLCLLPGGLIFGLFLFRKKEDRRWLREALFALLFAISMAATGCGGLDIHGTPAGSYTFNVTAIGSKTAVTVSAPMSLTVTQ